MDGGGDEWVNEGGTVMEAEDRRYAGDGISREMAQAKDGIRREMASGGRWHLAGDDISRA